VQELVFTVAGLLNKAKKNIKQAGNTRKYLKNNIWFFSNINAEL